MKVLHSVHPGDFKSYDTQKIRENFLMENLVEPGKVNLVYTHYDRMIVGVANPAGEKIALPNYPNLRANFFLERREMGIINVGGNGEVIADGKTYPVNKLDCLYLGKGVKEVHFASSSAAKHAVFYILSAPAHAVCATTLLSNAEAVKVTLGSLATANLRTINKYIHHEGIKSCQLVMGLTILHEGSVWNTMPAHVHDRRMEAYFYFDIPAGQKVFHYMGEAHETRHIITDNYNAVVSPPWSIHSGSGTASYSFIWGMAGENLDYTDMDALAITDLR
ncbi:5-dehydro-4-deoxy-D-glucuronate isomerase [Mucilaginibacter rigui]|uniref:4-deoxy-L-threo-5-hexosulose-uronate ketol-isomerase n=1 Tax=Mucilaginibacter rigui TaxID=534635 RepID=A0ABR7X7D7_9SPHI|nr:5-dehydro-4-deoxy-D-glucuronate isomerase [Mucilaginibacter rigui]MBD1386479.1 5-dehydro-4-deoxy-D-glucuronate isomerase [Mucilaginibacter rigui]